MRQTTRRSNSRNRSDLSLQDIARQFNPILRGWLDYYGKHHASALYPLLQHFNMMLVANVDDVCKWAL
jgi:RNA-directed DNA polymerase